jgi:hypothetical protein
MQIEYIIESKYYNGDKYADKVSELGDVAVILQHIAAQDRDGIADEDRIDSKQISVTTEEA